MNLVAELIETSNDSVFSISQVGTMDQPPYYIQEREREDYQVFPTSKTLLMSTK